MKRIIVVVLAALLFGSCGKSVSTSDVLTDLVLSTHSIDGDGSSSVTVTVTLNNKASADRRNVVFTTTGGSFSGGANGKITVPATYVGQKLVAAVTLNGPMSAGMLTITAAPETLSLNGDYQLKDSVKVNQVDPATIKLESSSLGIASNFLNTDTIIGTLRSAGNKKVSLKAKVTFTATANGNNVANGFRLMQNSSDGNSLVMVLFSAPQLNIGDQVLIRATIDGNGYSDIIKLTVNQ